MNFRDGVNIMVDIESLNNNPWGGVILEVGAVVFPVKPGCPLVDIVYDPIDPKIHFRKRILIEDSLKEGLKIDGDTFKWWLDESRYKYFMEMIFDEKAESYKRVLNTFREWIGTACDYKWAEMFMWSHGTNYDLGILGNHYRTALKTKSPPWRQKNEMDTRTLFRLYTMKHNEPHPWENNPYSHSALPDACVQARSVKRAVEGLL